VVYRHGEHIGSEVDTAMVHLYECVNRNFSMFTDIYNKLLTDGHARVHELWGCEDTDHAISTP
jgi:hypothetical protein